MDDHRIQPLKPRAAATDHAVIVSFVRRLLRAEDGIALPVAMSAMMLVLALGAGAAATSLRTNSAVIKDRAAKQAQGAAETGLQLGYLRLAQASGVLEPTDCVTLTKAAPVNGECPAGWRRWATESGRATSWRRPRRAPAPSFPAARPPRATAASRRRARPMASSAGCRLA
jgi:hypothetical protein